MRRDARGLARLSVLGYGFRPFFLGAAAWAALAMILWLGTLTAGWGVADAYGALAWHSHELLIGYTSAVITGFLLTAIPNWTGRLPVRGGPLLALFLLWFAGRAALLLAGPIGPVAAATVEGAFLVVLVLVVLREIVAGRNWRNLKTAGLVAALAAANIGFHAETLAAGAPDYSLRAAVGAIIGLIMLVGGRIVPSFTRNWLARREAARLPVAFNRFDVVSIMVSGAALVIWTVVPAGRFTAAVLLLGGLFQAVRLSRWAGAATWREPLVLVLHLGYAFVPLGFMLVSAAVLWPGAVHSGAALHAWTTGAVGTMTLAVMTRASLGHTGRPLTATAATVAIYFAVLAAALARIATLAAPDITAGLLVLAAAGWIAAFGGFVLAYGPKLVRAA